MASKSSSSADLSYRERSVDETLDDHEQRITTNERWRLLLKGAVAGLAMAEGFSSGLDVLIGFL